MDELLQQYGGAGSVLTLIGLLIINWWRSRNDKTLAQAEAMKVMSTALQTALKSLSSLQTQIDGLLVERTAANAARIAAQNQIDGFKDELRHQQAERAESESRLAAAISALKAQAKSQDDQIARLQREAEQKDGRIAQLLNRVETLEREARDKDRKVEELNLALTQAECDKQELATKLTALEAKINGKVDKQPVTPGNDLVASVERARESQSEAGAESTVPQHTQE